MFPGNSFKVNELPSEGSGTLRVLHLEDEPDDVVIIAATLRRSDLQVSIRHVDNEADFRAGLAGDVDIILSDVRLPLFDGRAALELARTLRPDVPFVFVTGFLGEEVVVETLRQGAADYILKDHLTRLPVAVRRAVTEAAEQRRRRDAEQALELMSRLPEENPAPVMRVDNEMRLSYANPAAKHLLAGQTLDKDQGLPAEIVQVARQVLADGHRVSVEMLLGSQTYAVTLTPVAPAHSVNLYFLDITERKQAEQALASWHAELETRVQLRTTTLQELLLALQKELDERRRSEAEIFAAIERERLQLGLELHEDLAQQLTGLRYLIDCLPKEKDALTGIHHLQQLLQQCVSQTRQLALGCYPVNLQALGLVAALQQLAQQVASQNAPTICTVAGRPDSSAELPAKTTIQLFRIAQDAVQRALSADATRIHIEAAQPNGHFSLTIRDNGLLPPDKNSVEQLTPDVLQHRAKMIQATLTLTTEPELGSTLHCRVPLPERTPAPPARREVKSQPNQLLGEWPA